MQLRNWLAGAASALMLAAAPAAAQDQAPGAADGWRFTLTPYLWATSIGGDVALPRRGVEFDADFGDILSSLQFAAMGMFEARRGRFSLVADFLTTTLEQDFSTPAGVAFRGGSARMSTTSASAVALVRVVEEPGFGLDVGAGLRAWWLDTKISLNAGALAARSASADVDFADPILALRAEVVLSERFALVGYADVGGFDASSRSTWQLLGVVNWRITDSITAHVGYRHLALERTRGDLDANFALSGPIFGASFRF